MTDFNAAFWKWFGKSKTIGNNGDPVVFWRGDADPYFHVFDRHKTRENAFFFTPIKSIAKIYSRHEEPRAYYLKIIKPLDLTNDSPAAIKFITKWAKRFDEWIDRQSGEKEDPADFVFSGRLFDYEGNWSSERWLDLQDYIEASGYDGAILPDWDNDTGLFPSVIVFKPTQVKSIQNDGTWDADDPDIRSNPGNGDDFAVIAKRARDKFFKENKVCFSGGNCEKMSEYLYYELKDNGYDPLICSGEFVWGVKKRGELASHTWVTVKGTVIDISADQFGNEFPFVWISPPRRRYIENHCYFLE